MKKIKFVYIYFIILFLLAFGYYIDNPLKQTGIYEIAIEYFGITLGFIIFFFVVEGLIYLFQENNFKRKVYEFRLVLFLILNFLGLYTYILLENGLNINNIDSLVLDKIYFRNLIDMCIYKYKIGYVPTYLFYLLLNLKYKFRDIFYGIVGAQFLIVFLITCNPIRIYIRNSIKSYKAKKEKERKEKLLYEQIKIKESLERKETERKLKYKRTKEQDMEERIKGFTKGVKLQKTINFDNITEKGKKEGKK